MPCDCLLDAAAKVTDCECTEPGFCPRHQCEKNGHFHSLCRSRPDYFALWEAGTGPCLKQDGHPVELWFGLGDLVALLVHWVTFGRLTAWPGCGCHRRKQFLNRVKLWRLRNT